MNDTITNERKYHKDHIKTSTDANTALNNELGSRATEAQANQEKEKITAATHQMLVSQVTGLQNQNSSFAFYLGLATG